MRTDLMCTRLRDAHISSLGIACHPPPSRYRLILSRPSATRPTIFAHHSDEYISNNISDLTYRYSNSNSSCVGNSTIFIQERYMLVKYILEYNDAVESNHFVFFFFK